MDKVGSNSIRLRFSNKSNNGFTIRCNVIWRTQSRCVASPIEVVLSNDEVRLKADVCWSVDGHLMTRPESYGRPERLSPVWPYACSSKAHVTAIQGHSCPAMWHEGRPVGATRSKGFRKSKGGLAEVSLARTTDNWRCRSGNDAWKTRSSWSSLSCLSKLMQGNVWSAFFIIIFQFKIIQKIVDYHPCFSTHDNLLRHNLVEVRYSTWIQYSTI